MNIGQRVGAAAYDLWGDEPVISNEALIFELQKQFNIANGVINTGQPHALVQQRKAA